MIGDFIHRSPLFFVFSESITSKNRVNTRIKYVVGRDRKSTRLNSSHVRISYAVFCLKKKTNRDCRANVIQPSARIVSLLQDHHTRSLRLDPPLFPVHSRVSSSLRRCSLGPDRLVTQN